MIKQLQQKANEVRRKVLENCYKYKNSHLSSCLSAVDIISTLYFGGFIGEGVGKFVLSKGHANETLSTILEMMGMQRVRHTDHPEFGNVGIETTTGSLGQGLGIAVGIALANKINNSNEKVYVLVGDGEMMEGLTQEAIHSIYDLDLPIKVLIDKNWYASERQPGSLLFGTVLKTMINGHDVEQIYDALQTDEKVIVCDTTKCFGLHRIHDINLINWNMIHYLTPNDDNIEEFRKELNDYSER
ncbi:MAG: thiamine pyrophosphate-dependent enzyme [Melioribacteraceae bacterium]|jgi:transketolase|nr:thiamine pyrophosphate-dependent enzyme [Melioribacteraceae bacterium]